jgi:hypothetical protein
VQLTEALELCCVRPVRARCSRLEDRGQLLKRRLDEEHSETVTHLTLADRGVTVAVRAKRRRGVVDVKGA